MSQQTQKCNVTHTVPYGRMPTHSWKMVRSRPSLRFWLLFVEWIVRSVIVLSLTCCVEQLICQTRREDVCEPRKVCAHNWGHPWQHKICAPQAAPCHQLRHTFYVSHSLFMPQCKICYFICNLHVISQPTIRQRDYKKMLTATVSECLYMELFGLIQSDDPRACPAASTFCQLYVISDILILSLSQTDFIYVVF